LGKKGIHRLSTSLPQRRGTHFRGRAKNKTKEMSYAKGPRFSKAKRLTATILGGTAKEMMHNKKGRSKGKGECRGTSPDGRKKKTKSPTGKRPSPWRRARYAESGRERWKFGKAQGKIPLLSKRERIWSGEWEERSRLQKLPLSKGKRGTNEERIAVSGPGWKGANGGNRTALN